jgi:hypothetical protein
VRSAKGRGLTALFWSNVNPYGTFRLDMGKRPDLGLTAGVPCPRTPVATADRSSTGTPVLVAQILRPDRLGQDLLHQQRVDMHERGPAWAPSLP